MTKEIVLTPVKDAAKNRFNLLLKTVELSRGAARLKQTEWHPTHDDEGKSEVLIASWIEPGKGNQGFAVDYFNERRVRVRVWGSTPNYDIAVFTHRPSYHLMIEVAIMGGLLNGDLS